MTTRGIFVVGLLFLAYGTSAAESTGTAKNWKESAELTLINTTGNSRATTYGAKQLFTYNRGRAGVEVKAGALGSKSGRSVTAEQYNASEKVTWKIRGAFYNFERFAWDKNRFAGILNRYDASGGFGWGFFENRSNQLLVEFGGAYISEERSASGKNEFASGRAFTKFTRALGPNSRFVQEGTYNRNFKDGRDYRVHTDTALIASISTHLSLKVSYEWRRVNRPPAGFVKDDTITAMAIILNY